VSEQGGGGWRAWRRRAIGHHGSGELTEADRDAYV